MLRQTKLIALGVLLSLLTFFYAFRTSDSYFEITKNLELLSSMLYELDAYYVDDIDPDKLVQTGMDAMLQSLDPYTTFIPEQDLENYKQQTTGKYGGIGSLIRQKTDHIVISDPYEGFPAAKNDLRAGDKLLKINGVSVLGKTTSDVSQLLKGSPGTDVTVVLERLGESAPLTKTLTREEIKVKSVPYADVVKDDIAYLRLGNFTDRCSDELSQKLKKLHQDENLKGIILDLRGNPGGLLNEAINVANVFLPRKTLVVSTKNRKRDWDKNYHTQYNSVDEETPLVVLIDRGSASASEIVAGVMQDLDRGLVIGQRSFGKGLVQTTKNLTYNSKVKLTTAKYFLPSQRCIQAIDYSGGYSDKLAKVPDSLRTVYYTKNKRKVLDAGGIDPDFEVESQKYGNITFSLASKLLIFDYATQYRSENASIPNPDKFELSDADFEKFVKFIADKDYEYVTESESLLKNLKQQAEKEKYLSAIEAEITELENKIKHDKQKDLYKFKNEVKSLLEYEIVSRYYYQTGEIAETLEDDLEVMKAMEVLKNTTKYQQLLGM